MDEKIAKAFEMIDNGTSQEEALVYFSEEDQTEIKSIFGTMDLLTDSFAEFNSAKPNKDSLVQTINLLKRRESLTWKSKIRSYLKNCFHPKRHPFFTTSLSFILMLSVGGLYFWEDSFFFSLKPNPSEWGHQEIAELEEEVFAVIDEPLINFDSIELGLDKISEQTIARDSFSEDLESLANDLKFLEQDLDNLDFNLNNL